YKAYTLILGEGLTSRDEQRDSNKRESELKELKNQAIEANKVLGVSDTYIYDFPDNRFDTVPLLDIIKVIENIKKEVKPYLIFTHYGTDLNIDHQITYRAVITASRPVCDETVKEIYSFELPSSTEWNYPLSFSPDVFFDVNSTLEYKLKAMEIYGSELRAFPHPRSLDGIRLNAEYRGMQVGLRYAEAFKSIRVVR
ncbi:PIG-L family deacetylase, partial [bacterium]|nr:PIG-L family deacetylase [bacterium]